MKISPEIKKKYVGKKVEFTPYGASIPQIGIISRIDAKGGRVKFIVDSESEYGQSCFYETDLTRMKLKN